MANRTRATALAAAAACTLAAVLLSACATGTPDVAASGEPSSGGSAPDASVRPSPGTPSPSGTGAGDCATGTVQIAIRPGETPQPVCLRVGAVLRIDAPASPRQPWQPFTSSDPQVVGCTTAQGQDGAATATCAARRAGSATISTMTGPFAGDPHGPMQQQWQIVVQVRD
jgi:hypothetical protein